VSKHGSAPLASAAASRAHEEWPAGAVGAWILCHDARPMAERWVLDGGRSVEVHGGPILEVGHSRVGRAVARSARAGDRRARRNARSLSIWHGVPSSARCGGTTGSSPRFYAPGKLSNRLYESFNGKLRDECLNANQFLSIADPGAERSKRGGRITTITRPHSALGNGARRRVLDGATTGTTALRFFQQ